MNFNRPKTTFNLYEIDKEFLAFLKTKDKNVLDSKDCNLYCGPVFTVKNTNFYVPVLLEQKSENEENILIDFVNGKLAYLDFNHMIPCRDKLLTKTTDKSAQKNFCLNNRELIEKCAEKQFNK